MGMLPGHPSAATRWIIPDGPTFDTADGAPADRLRHDAGWIAALRHARRMLRANTDRGSIADRADGDLTETRRRPTPNGAVNRHREGRQCRQAPSPSSTISIEQVGHRVRSADAAVVGEVEGIRSRGFRVHRLSGHPTKFGYLPDEAVAQIDRATSTILLRPGVTVDTVAGAPPPPGDKPDAWRKSDDWWANFPGHYGLFESEGRGNEPLLHPDQR